MSSNGRRMATGPNALVEDVLEDYGLGAETLGEDLVESDTDRLLLALLLEQRGAGSIAQLRVNQRNRDLGTSGSAEYENHAQDVTDSEWREVELDIRSEEIDLRQFGSDILVAFSSEPSTEEDQIPYNSGEEPVVGIPVETESVHLRCQDGQGDTTMQVDAWGQGGN